MSKGKFSCKPDRHLNKYVSQPLISTAVLTRTALLHPYYSNQALRCRAESPMGSRPQGTGREESTLDSYFLPQESPWAAGPASSQSSVLPVISSPSFRVKWVPLLSLLARESPSRPIECQGSRRMWCCLPQSGQDYTSVTGWYCHISLCWTGAPCQAPEGPRVTQVYPCFTGPLRGQQSSIQPSLGGFGGSQER